MFGAGQIGKDPIIRRYSLRRGLHLVLLAAGILSLTACQSDAEFIGDVAASDSLTNVSDYFTAQFEFGEGEPALDQVRDWIDNPDPTDLEYLGNPTVITLASHENSLDAVIYAFGRGPGALMSKVSGWGHRCLRFYESHEGSVTTEEYMCPNRLPADPNSLL
ncbi:hypothetical protein GCM10027417_01340 [Glutamicibacter endophyticus]